ncbi:hypothetical protein EDB89DRAFT_1906687, partial [Lactarius sanguifluus]
MPCQWFPDRRLWALDSQTSHQGDLCGTCTDKSPFSSRRSISRIPSQQPHWWVETPCTDAPTDTVLVLAVALTSEFPSLTNGPQLLYSINVQLSFKEGEPSEQVATLLERVQSAVPSSPDIDEDNTYKSWGHYQFTAGGISLVSSLTSWEKVGSIATAFKLVAATIKMCRDARSMCSNAGTPKTSGFISDVYLEKILECLESCWVGTGG